MQRKEWVQLKAVWYAMWARCTKPHARQFADYGGRGIKVCSEWKSFEIFLQDMGERPVGYTLERRDNNAGYTKENCFWASWSIQALNKRERKDASALGTGIYADKRDGTYVANIRVNSVLIHLYQGPSLLEAERARLAGESFYRGAP